MFLAAQTFWLDHCLFALVNKLDCVHYVFPLMGRPHELLRYVHSLVGACLQQAIPAIPVKEGGRTATCADVNRKIRIQDIPGGPLCEAQNLDTRLLNYAKLGSTTVGAGFGRSHLGVSLSHE